MVQANELRIGNILLLKKKYIKVIIIDNAKTEDAEEPFVGYIENGKTLDDNGYKLAECKELKGIKLTAEILEKCGFKHDKITYGLGQIMLAEGNVGFDVWYNTLTYGLMNLKLQYLHQLQNFVFALTQKELVVNFNG